jgi:hypothetical protein
VTEQDAGQPPALERAVVHGADDGQEVEDLFVPGVPLEEIGALEGLDRAGHARVAEVETVGDEPAVRKRTGDPREHAVVLVALEPVGNQDDTTGPRLGKVRVADDRLAFTAFDRPLAGHHRRLPLTPFDIPDTVP